MRLLVNLAEAFLADVRVELRGGQVGVTQELLHSTKIGTVVQKMSGEGVSKGVGVRRRSRTTVEDASHVSGPEASADVVEEERIGR